MNVVVKLMGGLGNQMFQYSFGLQLSEVTGRNLILDTSFLERKDLGEGFVYRDYDLDVFDISCRVSSGFSEDLEVITQSWDWLHKIEPGVIERCIESRSKNLCIEGYWQSPKYFDCRQDIFKFSNPLDDKSLNLAEEIESSNSVMINIRRTDFINNNFSGYFGREYVEKAMEKLDASEKYNFYIFSDDPDWCEENLSDLGKVVDHSHKGFKFSNYLQLMMRCKYFIIPNSSFAWWSAYLSKNKKRVMYPERWIKSYPNPIEDLFPSDWVSVK